MLQVASLHYHLTCSMGDMFPQPIWTEMTPTLRTQWWRFLGEAEDQAAGMVAQQ